MGARNSTVLKDKAHCVHNDAFTVAAGQVEIKADPKSKGGSICQDNAVAEISAEPDVQSFSRKGIV
jgi:hypothetical protein